MENKQIENEFPIEILYGDLTLEEIGAILVLFYSKRIPDFSVWKEDERFKEIIMEFNESGIITNNDGELDIDLSWI